jgi:RHS repeat-associated protein
VDLSSVAGSTEGGYGTYSNPYMLFSGGGTLEIDVASNSHWEITNTPAWLTRTSSNSGGSGSSVSTFTYNESINDDPRLNGYIQYTAEGETFRVYVRQNSKYFLPEAADGTYIQHYNHPVYGEVYEVNGNSGNFVVDLSTTTEGGTAVYSDSWISGQTNFSGIYETHTVSFTKNPKGNQERVATVTLNSVGLSEEFNILQQEAAPDLSVEPDNYLRTNTLPSGETQYVFDRGGGNFQVEISCNTDWSFGSFPEWMFTPTSPSGQYDKTITFSYSPYAGPDEIREAELVFTAEYQEQKLFIAQESSELTVEPDPDSYLSANTIDIGYEVTAQEYVLSEKGGGLTLDVEGEASVNWELDVEEGNEWLIPAGSSSGSGTRSVTFNYPVNHGSSRTGTINLMFLDNVVGTVYLKQKTIDRYYVNSPYNWIQTTSYAEEGRILGQSIAYYDKLGKPTQTISREVTNGKVIASETVYDDFGRPWVTTLPTPVSQNTLNYIDNFLDLNTLLDINEIPISTKCGSYYSNDNTEEPYVPQSNRAFTKTEYSMTQPGAVRKNFMPGEEHYDDHPVQNYVVHASPDELLNHPLHYNAGVNLFALKTTSQVPDDPDKYSGMTKSVSIDPEGKESITYFDAEGKTIASCISADGALSIPVTVSITGGYADIHLPAKDVNYTITKTGSWYHEVIDLKTDDLVSSGSASSINLVPGVYRIASSASQAVFFQYNAGYRYYSFNAYDEAGRLVRSLSPKDAEEIAGDGGANTNAMLEDRCSQNTYNALGQLTSSYSQDEGETLYLYSKDGKIRFSQNAQQQIDNTFSFTNYDKDGRIVVAGECFDYMGYLGFSEAGTYPDLRYEEGEYDIKKVQVPVTTEYPSYLPYSDLTFTWYDYEHNADIAVTSLEQEHLRGRVSKTMNENSTTWYSYTYDGLVDRIVQKNKGFDADGDAVDDFFIVQYTYDFLNNVETAEYYITDAIGDKRNGFTHRYEYDFDNRLSAVYTRAQGETEILQARYEYYQHGPLKRVELADGLQGIDYVYTIHGWLKSINHPSLNSHDPGKDGVAGSVHEAFQADVFAMALDYFEKDYERTGTYICSKPAYDRYDGNIAMQRWQNSHWSTGNLHNTYKYDYNDRNYLSKAVFGAFNSSTKVFTEDTYDGYLVKGPGTGGIEYDANGNILNLLRMNAGYTAVDDLSYNYIDGTNQLDYVDNAGVPADISIADQSPENYTYNAVGRMTGNAGDGHYFRYDAYGMVTGIYNSTTHTYQNLIAQYDYDDRGFRIRKNDRVHNVITWYLRDLSGNILATYTKEAGTPEIDEVPLYGTSRIGMAKFSGGSLQKCVYELGDHLGNVRATVAWDDETPGISEIFAAKDYYPGGMVMPGRTFTAESYRWGYQGQYALDETDETGYYSFDLRLYDPRILRWHTTDPYGQYWSSYMSMGNNWINMIDPDGGWDDDYSIDADGNIKLEKVTNDNFDMLYTKADYDAGNLSNGLKIYDRMILPQLANRTNSYEFIDLGVKEMGICANTRNRTDAYRLFKFMAENTTVEWSYQRYTDGTLAIATANDNACVAGGRHHSSNTGKLIAASVHSHPGTTMSDLMPSNQDYWVAKELHNENPNVKVQLYMPKAPNPNARWLDLVSNKWINVKR